MAASAWKQRQHFMPFRLVLQQQHPVPFVSISLGTSLVMQLDEGKVYLLGLCLGIRCLRSSEGGCQRSEVTCVLQTSTIKSCNVRQEP